MSLQDTIALSIPPGQRILYWDESQRLSVIGIERVTDYEQSSNLIPNSYVLFSSSDPSLISVDSNGLLTPEMDADGSVFITAKFLGISTEIELFLVSGPVSRGYAMGPLGLTYAD